MAMMSISSIGGTGRSISTSLKVISISIAGRSISTVVVSEDCRAAIRSWLAAFACVPEQCLC